jgi:hypothetical protein
MQEATNGRSSNGAVWKRCEGIPPAVRRKRADRDVAAGIGETEWRPDARDWGEKGWLMVGCNGMAGQVGPWVGSG